MPINTQTRRRSLTAMPGITTLPVVDGEVDVFDRRHCCDVPASVATQAVAPFTFWRKVAHGLLTPWVRQADTPPD